MKKRTSLILALIYVTQFHFEAFACLSTNPVSTISVTNPLSVSISQADGQGNVYVGVVSGTLGSSTKLNIYTISSSGTITSLPLTNGFPTTLANFNSVAFSEPSVSAGNGILAGVIDGGTSGNNVAKAYIFTLADNTAGNVRSASTGNVIFSPISNAAFSPLVGSGSTSNFYLTTSGLNPGYATALFQVDSGLTPTYVQTYGNDGGYGVTFSPNLLSDGNAILAALGTNGTNQTISTLEVPGLNSLSGPDNIGGIPTAPDYQFMAFSPDGTVLAVPDQNGRNVATVSVNSSGQLTYNQTNSIASNPVGVAFSPAASTVYLAAANSPNSVTLATLDESSSPGATLINPKTFTLPANATPTSVAFSPYFDSNLYLAVSDYANGAVYIYSVFTPPVGNQPSPIACCARSSVTGAVSATPGSADITGYSFTSPTTNGGTVVANGNDGNFTYRAPTNGYSGSDSFTFTASDSNGCTSLPVTVDVTIYAIPVGTPHSPIACCAGFSVDGAVTATPGSGSIESYSFNSPTTHNGTVIANGSSGSFTYTPADGYTGSDSFTFTASDTNGCTSLPVTVDVTVYEIPVGNQPTTPFACCPGSTVNGSVSATAGSGTISSYSFSSAVGGTVQAGTALGSFIFTAGSIPGTGSFTFTASDTNGCTSLPVTVDVTVYEIPVGNQPTTPFACCAGSSVRGTVSATPGSGNITGYSFNSAVGGTVQAGSTPGSFIFTGSMPGTGSFQFTASDTNGCTSTPVTVDVTIHAPPVGIQPTTPFACCAGSSVGGTVTATATSPATISSYSFSSAVGGTVQAGSTPGSFIFTGTTPGTGSFQFTATDSNNCISSPVTVDVTIYPLPVGNQPTTSFACCPGSSVSGTVTATATSPATISSYSFSALSGGTVQAGSTPGSFTFTAGSMPGTGSFQFTATDSNNCISSPVTVDVTIYPLPVGNQPTTSFACCPGSSVSGTVTATATSPATISSYSFSSAVGGTVQAGSTPGSFTFTAGSTPGTGSFQFTATDSNNCISSPVTVDVTIYALPVGTTGSTVVTCAGVSKNGTVSATATSPATISSYSFSSPTTQGGTVVAVGSAGGFTYTPAAGYSGSDSFTFTATDSNGCTSVAVTVNVTVNANPSATISASGPTNFCTGADTAVTLTASTDIGTSYQWLLNGSPISGATNSTYTTPANLVAGTYSYTAQVATTDCTTTSSPQVVSVNALPAVSITPASQTVCSGKPFTLTANVTGGSGSFSQYVWTTPARGTINTTVNSLTLNDATTADTGNYTVVVTDSNDCSSTASADATVSVDQIPVVSVSASATSVIAGNSVVLTATPSGGVAPYQLVWSDGFVQDNVTGVTPRTVTPRSTTSYSLVIIDANGCQSDPSLSITINVMPNNQSALSNAIQQKYCPNFL